MANPFQTIPGVYGSMPLLNAGASYRLPMYGLQQDTLQFNNRQNSSRPMPWYVKAGKEILKTGVVISASILGGVVGNVPGAMAAGAAAAGAVSAIDQKWTTGRVNWGSAAIDTLLGLIPAGVGGTVVKGIQSLVTRQTGKALFGQTSRQILAKGATIGAVDGAAIGYAGGVAHNAYDSRQQTGKTDWAAANISGLKALLPGALGGAVFGGALAKIAHSHTGSKGIAGQAAPKPARPFETSPEQPWLKSEIPMPTAEALKTLKAGQRTWLNRLKASLWLGSEDTMLGNFHAVDNHVLRGAMPETEQAFAHLRDHHHVKTIIDLRGAGEGATTQTQAIQYEMGHAQASGIRYLHLPMDSHRAPSQAELQIFFQAVRETRDAGGKVYVHCKHGVDRTGAIIAAYEVATGQSQQTAYSHMKRFGYDYFHQKSRPAQKAFVQGAELQQTLKTAQTGAQLRTLAKTKMATGSLTPANQQAIYALLDQGQLAEARTLLDRAA